jgi:hypothetical protein
MKRLSLLLAALAIAASLTACGSTKNVSKSEIEQKAQAFFDGVARKNGQASFPKITCPGGLEAKKGKSERCSAKGTDGTLGITVTISKVSGDNATLSFKADNAVH